MAGGFGELEGSGGRKDWGSTGELCLTTEKRKAK